MDLSLLHVDSRQSVNENNVDIDKTSQFRSTFGLLLACQLNMGGHIALPTTPLSREKIGSKVIVLSKHVLNDHPSQRQGRLVISTTFFVLLHWARQERLPSARQISPYRHGRKILAR